MNQTDRQNHTYRTTLTLPHPPHSTWSKSPGFLYYSSTSTVSIKRCETTLCLKFARNSRACASLVPRGPRAIRSKMAALEKKYVKNKISLLNAGIQVAEDEAAKREEVLSHIKSVDKDSEFRLDPEFPSGLNWFNSAPLSFSENLKGKVVVLDFFTYCCINCMHILPDLAELEQAHSVEDGLVIVGVHSAKFLNEKLPDNIENAIRRYDIHHPVVNDSDIVLWNRLGVVCWPTLVVIGPDQQLLHYIIGEGHSQELKLFVDTAVQYYNDAGRLSKASITTSVIAHPSGDSAKSEKTCVLKYPGKVCCTGEEKRLYVSDTSHHRILVLEQETGVVSAIYGSGAAGLRNGEAGEAQFHSPQGMVRSGDNLYVAETENHAIRKV